MQNKLIHLRLVSLRAWCRIMWNRNILDFSTCGALQASFLGLINVITKTTYHPHSYNSSNTIILVHSFALLCLFPLPLFSLSMTVCRQPLTSFYIFWILCSYLLWFFSSYLLWFFCSSAILLSAYKLFHKVPKVAPIPS